ncbi:MAG: eukaryotic-like serine/threonine-protein kinase, partial [Solirubrobacteraceae bacterium]|nr:eukaryotic-like serine/threonine-protein kinase [Solirubrobacteraceae bacterium]
MSLEPFALPERYRLERGIAAGGMAAVYAAHDTLLNRPVAVKVLADHLNDDPVARQRFQREARAAAGLSSHPGVVTIFDVGEHAGRSFLVMERRAGTLADAGRVSTGRALGWLHTIADALDTAHAQGVVHRDIKPGNLLLDDHDRLAVADFGIASLAYENEQFTQTGQVLGTAAYLSPEQAAGEPATPASDRYALAVVAYELLTGTKPFTASHFAAQARAHIEDRPPPAPGLPHAAQRVLERGLAKDPGARWGSAAEFVDALAPARDAAPPPPPRPATGPTRALPAQPRRRGPLVAALIA